MQERSGRLTVIALAFAAGIGAGDGTGATPETWLAGALASAVLAFAIRRRTVVVGALAVAAAMLGAAWMGVRRDAVAPDDLLAGLDVAPVSIHVYGTALEAPVSRPPGAGSFGRYDFRGPSTEFPLEVEGLLTRDGRRQPMHGRLMVRIGQTVAPFRAGDRVVARGAARRGTTPRNPGGFDHDRFLRSRGYAGVLTVNERTQLIISPSRATGVMTRLARLRTAFRERAEMHLFQGLPRDTGRDAVLGALLFGHRDRSAPTLGAAFRRVGLAHLLAISGLHLGILVGLVLFATRARGGGLRQAVLVAGVVLLYLLLIDVRLPVLRAAIMTTAGALARAGRHRWPGASLVSLSGIGLLAWRPQQLFEPGFQLSFGVVLALVRYGPGVRARWFGASRLGRDRADTTVAGLVLRWVGGAAATAAVAWAVATPITVYHFGMISPGAVPLSVIALPAVAGLLAVGYLKVLLASILPSAALMLGLALVPLTDGLILLVRAADAWPGSVVHVPRPSLPWAIAASAWSVAWARGDVTAGIRRAMWLGSAGILIVWLAWPMLPLARRAELRIDTLAVGDGTCHVLRSSGRTALFDAGSSTNLDAGRTVIVPALRAIGVHTIDWIAISHANLDHFSAVPEIVTAFEVTAILVTPQFILAAADDPDGPAAFLLAWVEDEQREVVIVTAGMTRPLGSTRVRWLHPPSAARYVRENDNAMVMAVETTRRRALFTGDIESSAIERLRRRYPALTADVLELPHHGSFNPAAAALVEQLDPAIILQSTGHRRLERDAWAPRLVGQRRLVTARDGACRVEIDGEAVRFGVYDRPWMTLADH